MTALPVLATGDIYLYAHANGAIYLGYGDGRSMLVTLADAVDAAEGCAAAGCRVVVGNDDEPIAVHVVERVRAASVPVEAFAPAAPPHSWGSGTDALMEAASIGNDLLLDDLVARGADVGHRDASGSTALHHAAANGNLHAIDALVDGGADLDLANAEGFTPLQLARACREHDAASRLIERGAAPSGIAGARSGVRFSRAHAGTAYVWLVPAAFVVVAVAAAWPLTPLVALGLAAFAGAVAVVAPPRPFWLGGIPQRLDATVLTVRRPFGRTRTVDLAEVTVAGLGGSTHRGARLGARWILLGHPAGTPVTRRSLRRLLVPPQDLDALAARMDRIVVVPLAGGRTDEVIRPVGNALSGLGIDLSSTLRAQLVRARSAEPYHDRLS